MSWESPCPLRGPRRERREGARGSVGRDPEVKVLRGAGAAAGHVTFGGQQRLTIGVAVAAFLSPGSLALKYDENQAEEEERDDQDQPDDQHDRRHVELW